MSRTKNQNSPKPASNRKKPPVGRRANTIKPKVATGSRVARVRERLAKVRLHTFGWFKKNRSFWRIVTQFTALVFVVALTFGLVTLVGQHVRSSGSFAIKDVHISGQDRLDALHLKRVAGVVEGKNIFEISPEDIEDHLEKDPWIATAIVERKLPRTLKIEIVERQPVALLALDSLYLVDGNGEVFKQVGVDDPVDLPVITGVEVDRFMDKGEYRRQIITAALALFHDYRSAGLWKRETIGEIHVESELSLTLYVGSDAAEVRLGRSPYRAKLRRLRKILDRMDRDRSRPAYVYLDNVHRPERVTVRLANAENTTENRDL